MIVYEKDVPIEAPLCLMIGNFDGVHLGHQRILAKARELASRDGCATAVLSFQPHPLKVLQPERAPALLQTSAQKKALLAFHGVDYYIVQPFEETLYTLSPEAFVARLKQRFHFKHLLVGFNFRFGYQRQGDTRTLQVLEQTYDYTTWVMEAASDAVGAISSSRIRTLVADGFLDQAAELLGRPYFLEGRVGHGVKLGRNMRTPTANFAVENELKPKFGVYASWCRLAGAWFRSITNFGEAPTVRRGAALCETHLFGFEGELYDKYLVVTLGQFLRPEKNFPDLETLKEQIQRDVAARLALADLDPPEWDLDLESWLEQPE